jgi:hypothetical protein
LRPVNDESDAEQNRGSDDRGFLPGREAGSDFGSNVMSVTFSVAARMNGSVQ